MKTIKCKKCVVKAETVNVDLSMSPLTGIFVAMLMASAIMGRDRKYQAYRRRKHARKTKRR